MSARHDPLDIAVTAGVSGAGSLPHPEPDPSTATSTAPPTFAPAWRHRMALRSAYCAGWRWGAVCGALAGVCTTGLLAMLIKAALAAWHSPAC